MSRLQLQLQRKQPGVSVGVSRPVLGGLIQWLSISTPTVSRTVRRHWLPREVQEEVTALGFMLGVRQELYRNGGAVGV